MAQRIVRDKVEMLEPEVAGPRLPSYHPTRWALVNRALDVVDEVSPGRAGWAQRFVSYGLIGGTAAVVNLIIFFVMYQVVHLPLNDAIPWQHAARFVVAFAVASELSIFANFIPNDYFTFRHLSGHQRTWVERAARFHVTALAGTGLTFLISASLHFISVKHILSVPATLGQAIAIAIVFLFNFAFHHIFTYRHIRH